MSERQFPQLDSLSLSGLAATFVGNGIGRFAYIALIPVLSQQAWFSRGEAMYLGAATLFGYLLGAPLVDELGRRIAVKTLLRLSFLVCSLSYFVCGWRNGGFLWFVCWRILAGFCGAILMVTAPHFVLRSKTQLTGQTGGVVFSGIGFGIVVSGTLIPILLNWGLTTVWLSLGIICFALTALTWNSWEPRSVVESQVSKKQAQGLRAPGHLTTLLLVAYALNAIGYLPHTLFWVDFTVTELHYSFATAGIFWAVFGVGAVLGPFLTGALADRYDFPKTLFAAFLLKAIGAALPLVDTSPVTLSISSFLVGLFTPGIAGAVSSFAMKMVGETQHKQYWGRLTFSFAATQAAIGFLMAFAWTAHGSYYLLFVISTTALFVSAICIASMASYRPGVRLALAGQKD